MDYEFSRPVQIEKIDKKGYQHTITPTQDEIDALCTRFDLASIQSLSASLKIMPNAVTYHVTGVLNANVEQISVVSGNPVPKTIEQDIDAWFTDQSKIASFEQAKKNQDKGDEDNEILDEKDDPERITNGMIDLGELSSQFLGLALDDYPRGADEGHGDYIEISEKDAKPNPFAVLEQLKKDT